LLEREQSLFFRRSVDTLTMRARFFSSQFPLFCDSPGHLYCCKNSLPECKSLDIRVVVFPLPPDFGDRFLVDPRSSGFSSVGPRVAGVCSSIIHFFSLPCFGPRGIFLRLHVREMLSPGACLFFFQLPFPRRFPPLFCALRAFRFSDSVSSLVA